MSEKAERLQRVLEALLEDASADLEMAQLGANVGNRLAAFHVQQAAEKLVKALRAQHGLPLTASHDIEELIEGNPDKKLAPIPRGAPARPELLALSRLTEYATAYRYPTPSGRRREVPLPHLKADIESVAEVLTKLREDLLHA